MMRIILAVAAMLVVAPTFALDAVSYKGTIGGKAVVVELTDLDGAVVAGRFSYLTTGADIPLLGTGGSGAISLSEEAECTEQTCSISDEGFIEQVSVAAQWTLSLAADGGTLRGSWAAEGKPGKPLAVDLVEIGRRTLPEGMEITPMAVWESTLGERYGSFGFPPEALPYDSAKMDIVLEEQGTVLSLEGSLYRFVADPRTQFPFPRVVSLADGSSPAAVNAALARRHATINANAFDCLSGGYAGFAYTGYTVALNGGGLGDYDGENVEVTYLSPTILNWTESGSTFCGGAHPNNHYDSYIVDVRLGTPLDLGKVFKDWIATAKIGEYGTEVVQAEAVQAPEDYYWEAGQNLVDYVLARRVPDDEFGFDAECEINELIRTNLGIRFAPGERAVFALQRLPHVNFACTVDLLTVKLTDFPELLAPTAVQYFPGLAK